MIKSIVPEGVSGDWSIEKFTVSEEEAAFFNLKSIFSFSGGGREILPGKYTRLRRGFTVVMSDTPAELSDYEYFVRIATGNVLINGLGLGCVLQECLSKGNIEKIVVNELSTDVFNLVAPYFEDSRLTINLVDAFTWKPSRIRFDTVWHDIWDNITEDNLEDMKKLHRRYGRWLQGDKYQLSWCRAKCESLVNNR